MKQKGRQETSRVGELLTTLLAGTGEHSVGDSKEDLAVKIFKKAL